MKIVSLRISMVAMLLLVSVPSFIACSTATPATTSEEDEDEDEDDDKKSSSKLTNEKTETKSAPKEEKEKKPDTTVVRRQMTNISDKITRAQANLARTESLKNNATQRLNDTKNELAQADLKKTYQQVGDVTVSNGGAVKKTKAELTKLVADQTAEVSKWDAEVKAIEDEIAGMEAELDALTFKLEKK